MHRAGEIAVIVVDNPPVNALKHEVRLGLRAAFANANADTNVAGIVLTCAGRTFIAGADITEFDKPPQSPSLIDLNGQIENIEKPVVAAVFGTPLGGGLEITLACHFRIAAPGTRLGLPEIKLGLIPGAGGTQRLPRLVGMEKAVAMILSGDPIPAQEALGLGLIDETFEGEPAAAGVAFARRVIAERRPLRRVRDIDDKLKDLRAQPDKFAEIAAPYIKRARGLDAP
ncbi:MAG: enoyl-CoA hydratase/isomerase family protein, partial [Pseudolabrys sp.]